MNLGGGDQYIPPAPAATSGGIGPAPAKTLALDDNDLHVYMDIDGANELSTGLYISHTPVVFESIVVNHTEYVPVSGVGDGVKTKPFYFSHDGGATARAIADIAIGDELFFNATIAGFGLVAYHDVNTPGDEIAMKYWK